MDAASEHERAKYVRAYQGKKYAQGAGMQAYKNRGRIEHEIVECDASSGTDFGCGNGRGALILADAGLNPVYFYDFMGPEYLDPEVAKLLSKEFQYGQFSLWDPALPAHKTDYNLCTDVMEHIPEPFVEQVLAAIRARTNTATFFRIAMFPCSPRKIERHGGALHVTVKPEQWWLERLLKHFDRVDSAVETKHSNPYKKVLVCTAWTSK